MDKSAYAAEPCEGCRKKFPAVSYRHRWCCASCAKDVLAGVKTINRPEYTEDYDPEPRWRDVSLQAHLARRASYDRFCETWRLRLYEQAPDAPWLRTWTQPCGPVLAMECPGAFRSWSGGWLRTVRSGTTTVAIGVTNRLIQFLTDLRSGCASSSATTLKCTPGTRSGPSLPICLRSENTGGAVMLMRETLRNLQSESSARTPGPAKAPPRGRGSGLSFRRFAQGWRLLTIQLKAGPTAGIDLGTAEHGDRRLLPPFGRTLQGSGHSNLRGVISRLRQCPQGRCQSAHQAGRLTMPLKLTLRMATLPL